MLEANLGKLPAHYATIFDPICEGVGKDVALPDTDDQPAVILKDLHEALSKLVAAVALLGAGSGK